MAYIHIKCWQLVLENCKEQITVDEVLCELQDSLSFNPFIAYFLLYDWAIFLTSMLDCPSVLLRSRWRSAVMQLEIIVVLNLQYQTSAGAWYMFRCATPSPALAAFSLSTFVLLILLLFSNSR